MAKVLVTFEDGDGGAGEVIMKIEFDPPARTKDKPTPAQAAAMMSFTMVRMLGGDAPAAGPLTRRPAEIH